MAMCTLLEPTRRSKSSSNIEEIYPMKLSSELSSPCPVKSFKFLFRTQIREEGEGVNSYLLSIPFTYFDFVETVNPFRYTPHDHTVNTDRFRRIDLHPLKVDYTHPDVDTVFWPVLLDSVVYDLLRICQTKPYLYLLQSLDLRTYDTTYLDPPVAPNRYNAKAFALCGKLYLVGGLSDCAEVAAEFFVEVFDPVTNKWSNLTPPPDIDELVTIDRLFATSLGDKEGKFMVYNPKPQGLSQCRIYIYDISVNGWETHGCPALDSAYLPYSIAGMEVVNGEDGNIYWIGVHGYIYCLDLKSMKLKGGRIVGLERVPLFRKLQGLVKGVTLFHLWDDIFCLLWSDMVLGDGPVSSEYHFTFLKMVEDPVTSTLTFYVLGCFQDSFDHHCDFLESICA